MGVVPGSPCEGEQQLIPMPKEHRLVGFRALPFSHEDAEILHLTRQQTRARAMHADNYERAFRTRRDWFAVFQRLDECLESAIKPVPECDTMRETSGKT